MIHMIIICHIWFSAISFSTHIMSSQLTDASGTTLVEHEDVHVEIEQVTTDDHDEDDDNSGIPPYGVVSNGNSRNLSKVQGKRTVILPFQRRILEEFFRTGMNSAAHHLHHLHDAAADQTGLELHVIKNWVRNRRRPTAAQKRQDMQQSTVVQAPPLVQPNVNFPNITTVTIPSSATHVVHTPPILTMPDSKRICTDGLSDSGMIPMIVKARIADSGETDFVEVEVEGGSYINLLQALCDELEVPLGEVAKIRKLPNILIRKDRDVARLLEGQELELVLKTQSYMSIMNSFIPHSTSPPVQLLNVNPLISTSDS